MNSLKVMNFREYELKVVISGPQAVACRGREKPGPFQDSIPPFMP
jgi:hypothetical protein